MLLVAYDIEARGPLSTVVTSHGVLGVGVVLAPAAGPGRWHGCAGARHADGADCAARAQPRGGCDNAMAGCMPFCELSPCGSPGSSGGLSPSLLLEMEVRFP